MITVALIAFPFLAALLLLIVPAQRSKQVALFATLIQLVITIAAIAMFDPWSRMSTVSNLQHTVLIPWIESLGVSFYVGFDGISLLMLMLTNFLLPLIVLSTWNRTFNSPSIFFALVLFMQSALNGVFASFDGFLYYIFWELALIPIYFIVLLWGGENRVKITFRFFIYTLVGSLFMLVAFIWLYLHNPEHLFTVDSLYKMNLDETTQRWVFWAFFLAYAIKIPLLPFHSWQPDTYTVAPNAGTMLLSGIMLKMGIYSIIRWILPITPFAVAAYTDIVLWMCIAGIIYGSWIALTRNDLKRLFAWSSIAHVGLITAGVFTLTNEGLHGALFQMMAHGLSVVGLFYVAEWFQVRLNTNDLNKLGGIRQQAPVFASVFMIITFSSVALPLTSGFVGEFLLLKAIYGYNPWMAALAGLTVILGAVYMLRAYKLSMLGEDKPENKVQDLNWADKLVFFPIVGLILFLGIYPQFLFNLTEYAVNYIIDVVNVKSVSQF